MTASAWSITATNIFSTFTFLMTCKLPFWLAFKRECLMSLLFYEVFFREFFFALFLIFILILFLQSGSFTCNSAIISMVALYLYLAGDFFKVFFLLTIEIVKFLLYLT